MTTGEMVKFLSEAGSQVLLNRFTERNRKKFCLMVYPKEITVDPFMIRGETLNSVCKQALKRLGEQQRHFMKDKRRHG